MQLSTFRLSKKPLSRGFPIPPRVLFLPFGDEKSNISREKVKGERSVLDNIPQRRDSVRERAGTQSLNAAPLDTNIQISCEDYFTGSACVFAPSLQIHGHTRSCRKAHAQTL